VDAAKSGAHSGEWETSLMLALRPKQVKMDRAAEGFLGELSEITSKVFDGIQNLDQNGVLGDPRPATAEAGKKYLEDIVAFLFQWIQEQTWKLPPNKLSQFFVLKISDLINAFPKDAHSKAERISGARFPTQLSIIPPLHSMFKGNFHPFCDES